MIGISRDEIEIEIRPVNSVLGKNVLTLLAFLGRHWCSGRLRCSQLEFHPLSRFDMGFACFKYTRFVGRGY